VTFQWPLALGLLALIPLALLAYAVYRRRVARNAVPFSDVDLLVQAAGPRRKRTYIPAALALGALAAFIVGLARPQADMQVPREQATIMLAIDTSGSMAADDVTPYRLRAAQDAAIAFSKTLPRQYRLGLVSFAGTAKVLQTPTTDREAFRAAVETLYPEGDTAIGEAIFASLDAMASTQNVDGTLEGARLVVLSDGKTRTGRSNEMAVQAAKAAGVPIATVALGTADGVLPGGQHVPPDPEALALISKETGGKSYTVDNAKDLSDIYKNLGSVIGTVTMSDEVTAWPAALGVLLLLLAGVATWRFGSRLP
jgi:Ca-activated chloride channel family protein